MKTSALLAALLLLFFGLGFFWVVFRGWPVFARSLPPGKRPAAEPQRLKDDVFRLSTTFGSRSWEHPENLKRVAEFIAERFRSLGSNAELEEFEVRGEKFFNVISRFPGSSRDEIVVAAHYDTAESLPGADDNASGVAGLLELARLLSLEPVKQGVIFAAYPLEEPPFFGGKLMGSAVHAEQLRLKREKIRLMIALEMIGYFSDAEGSQSYPLPGLQYVYPSQGNFIAVVGPLSFSTATSRIKQAVRRATDLPVHSINAPEAVPGVGLSDHKNFWDAGFDAVMVTDTAFFRNEAYHTENDVAERLDYERMGKVITGLYAFLQQGPVESPKTQVRGSSQRAQQQ